MEERPMSWFSRVSAVALAGAKPCLYVGCGVKYIAPPKNDTPREKLLRIMRTGASPLWQPLASSAEAKEAADADHAERGQS